MLVTYSLLVWRQRGTIGIHKYFHEIVSPKHVFKSSSLCRKITPLDDFVVVLFKWTDPKISDILVNMQFSVDRW